MSQPSRPLEILQFPFTGRQVIEASAGTGKTWTLSTLYLRLLLEPRADGEYLKPPQILVMTFTEAATQELRDRIRRRIGEAVVVFRKLPPLAGTSHDPLLEKLRDGRPPAGWLADAQRLEAAAQWMDEAAIHTIHGWSSRMLRQHAFDSVSLFEQDRVEDPRALLEDVVRDYWRQHFYAADREVLSIVKKLPATPTKLLEALRNEMALLDREPGAVERLQRDASPETPMEYLARVRAWKQRFDAAERAARDAWRADVEDIEGKISDAVKARRINNNTYKPKYLANHLQGMRAWCEGASLDAKGIERFSQSRLDDSANDGQIAPVHIAFRLLDAVVDCGPIPDATRLMTHAALTLRQALADRKARLAQFDFNDLLQRLYQALHDAERGGALAARLRQLYPVALVDEFQDTDPWQYGALQRIYADDPASTAALVMIGDPKQAIYGFRGADLGTYLRARGDAECLHTLTGNFRSTKGLVDAVNHVFTVAPRPFGEIDYQPVDARRDLSPLEADGRPLPAVTVWRPAEAGPHKTPALREAMAASFATGIVDLLSRKVVQPADVAVLVRTGAEARRIRKALDERGVRSVYLSDRDSVYASDEAQDLWYILRAVAEPRAANLLRAALSARCFDYSVDQLDRLFADDARFEQEAERFAGWQQVWQRHGVLAMLYALLHDQQIPARLLAKDRGERRLTNLLHLGDLLQQASQRLQGEAAVVRFLAEQLRDRPQDEGAAQVRLETDEGLVKVVTMHKSKGLQYPVVFVPFAYDFRKARSQDIDPKDENRLAEDRRLLYVAFTRAERALYIGAAERNGDITTPKKAAPKGPHSALSSLLGRQQPGDLVARLEGVWGHPDIAVEHAPAVTLDRYAPDLPAVVPRVAATPRRRHLGRWRSGSFTALTRGLAAHGAWTGLPTPGSEGDDRFADAQTDSPSTQDVEPGREPGTPRVTGRYQDFPGGARIGDLLHGLLEWQIEAGWPIAGISGSDPGQEAVWAVTLRHRAELLQLDASQQTLLHEWIRDLARHPLGASPAPETHPLPALAELSGAWPEMGFVLPARGLKVADVDRLLRAHILPDRPRESLTAEDLNGQLTGFLDLTFEHGGRYYVLDYKSNKLPDYGPDRLAEAVLGSRYELQYSLYLLALHRLLKSRLPGYDYDCHIGGAIYVFMRGIDTLGAGIHRDRPPRALIEALDRLFRGEVPA